MDVQITRTLAALAAAGVLAGAAWCGIAVGQADTVTVDAVDYPVCQYEDCSDQPGQVGVWTDPDTGSRWLSLGETVSVEVAR